MPGQCFGLTEYGRKWLENLSKNDVLPSDHGKFSTILAGHSARFGAGYHTRSQEALGCYQAQLYVSCCATCGAASESILLSMCIAKKGNEAEVLKEYGQSNGRSKLENYLMAGQNPHIHKVIPTLFEPLKYWRDNASHGQASSIEEDEAFVTLVVLMNLARFANDRWDEITA